ncbi:DUF494 family protein [Undibacterium baiyunense]|uniref:Protein Smg homolog n=1 Tax=Undibacterium baiyunense TaxID=2828731 RepID=A0A941DGG8_9BURK|nr:DUF494 domain-containing protein [Undibacterium baiyunense]MBR7748498.1 DUF494 domain-containing protein [Undibacterium baiyunense]
MFDILVYLYETYYRPDTCPDSIALAKKLSSVGFDEDEIIAALDWLSGLADTSNQLASDAIDVSMAQSSLVNTTGFRVFTEEEVSVLGSEAIGYLYYLQSTKVLDAQQREIVIERAMAVDEAPLSLSKFKVIVLMILWSQGRATDILMFDEFLLSDESGSSRLFH